MTKDPSAPPSGRVLDDRAARALAEGALRESEARFESALKAGRMGSWETDYQTMTRTWTAEGMSLFGLQLPDGRGHVGGADDEYVKALHPDDRHLAEQFHGLADQQDSFPAEYRIVKPDGTTLWLSGRGLVAERSADGRALRLVSIMADATERKQAEEQLRVEHQRLELALSAGRMGAYDMNIRDGVLWWSAQTYALFGVSPAHFVPTPASVIALLHPDERDTFLRLRAEAIAQHHPLVHEFRILRPDGTQAWLAHRGQIEYDAAGQPLRSFGITLDISERKQVEDILRDADRKKDRFIAMLAHELRNPLAPIRNAVALLRRSGEANPKAAWCHDIIERQVVQMARLLDDLLDASRLSRGQLRLRPEPMDLGDAIRQAIEIAQPLIDAGQHAFEATLPTQELRLEGDLTRLAQVFSNVLINAAKYTPPKGTITLRVERQGEQAVVTVADSGIGIDVEHVGHIFEMFGQVESSLSQAQGGQGIGLALAKGLVEMHGGSIGARSEGAGKGSEFEIRLPLATRARATALLDPPSSHTARNTRYRILIADDLRDAADSLAHALQALGHVVDVAYDGDEAVRLAAATRPDVVLLDLGMPKVDGCEACRRIRAAPWGGRMKVIAQTGWGQEQDRMRTREAGFDHHLVKPIDLDALVDLFER